MNEIGDWLGPAVALIWVLFRVVPRLLRRDSTGDGAATPGPGAVEEPSEARSEGAFGPPPIVPR